MVSLVDEMIVHQTVVCHVIDVNARQFEFGAAVGHVTATTRVIQTHFCFVIRFSILNNVEEKERKVGKTTCLGRCPMSTDLTTEKSWQS